MRNFVKLKMEIFWPALLTVVIVVAFTCSQIFFSLKINYFWWALARPHDLSFLKKTFLGAELATYLVIFLLFYIFLPYLVIKRVYKRRYKNFVMINIPKLQKESLCPILVGLLWGSYSIGVSLLLNKVQIFTFFTLQSILSYLLIFYYALCEELFFRGFIYNSLKQVLQTIKATLITFLFFSFTHLFNLFNYNHWGQPIGWLFFTLLITWIYEKSKSVTVCAFIHFFINLGSICWLYGGNFGKFTGVNIFFSG